jgi:hypothetical protein
VAKANKQKDRREVLEQLRREQQRAEKKRTSIIIVAAAVVGLVIVGLGAYPVIMDAREKDALEGTDLAALGVSADAASCTDPAVEKAEGNADHRDVGSDLGYDAAPPAAGPHYPTWAPLERKFYSAKDRPELGYLVHNLEHGYNILWYDQTVAEDPRVSKGG